MQLQSRLRQIALMGLMLALTLMIQMAGFPQPITGPAVNAILYLTTGLLGWRAACTVGLLTPLAALFRGQLPPVLAPLLPFIMLGNVILVVVYSAIDHQRWVRGSRRRAILAFTTSAVLKTAWLWLAVTWTLPLLLGRPLPEAAVAAMTLPQLFTALVGGAVAWAAFNILRNRTI